MGAAKLALAGALAALMVVSPAAAEGWLPDWLFPSQPTLPPSVHTGPHDLGRMPQHDSKDSDRIVKLPTQAAELDCPEVDIFDGGATARVGGADSQSVRYQFDITDVARQCDPQGSQFALKIGVAGRLLIGPAGSPGSYSSPLRITVKREPDGKPLFQKSISVAANTNGGAQAPFRIVTEPILLPLTRARLDEDYSISVGLGGGGGPAQPGHKRHHRR